jgi:hypothetical protein
VEAHRVVRRRGLHIFLTDGSQTAMSLSALTPGRPLPPGRFLVLISVRGWVDPRPIMRLVGLGQLENPMTSSGLEPTTFRLVAPQWPGELCWLECELLVEPPVPDRSEGGGQKKPSRWSSRLGFRRGSNDVYLLLRKHGGGQDARRVVALSELRTKKKTLSYVRNITFRLLKVFL